MAFSIDPDGAHHYRTSCTWTGSTGQGYEHFRRAHRVTSPPSTAELALSNDPSLHGEAELLDPEQLVLAAASSCQLLAFLAVAARARVDVTAYHDEAEAWMSTDDGPERIAAIELRPEIRVSAGPSTAKVERLVHLAHDECYIANSLATPVTVVPTIRFSDA